MTTVQRIAITAGEPAGIGPDLCIQLAQQQQNHQLVVIADQEMIKQRAQILGLPLTIKTFDSQLPVKPSSAGSLTVLSKPTTNAVVAGSLDAQNGQYVLDTLQMAIDGCQQGDFAAMVTAPVNKGIINEAGVAFSGHTEFLQEKTDTDEVVMMLATQGLRVALVTTHLPLLEVPAAITQDKVITIGRILYTDLQRHFGIAKPRILVCGLNPHAGENGHLGREEIEVIEPALKLLRKQGMDLIGPLPADTLFTDHLLNDADAVLAMYHDQGLPVLKYKGFGKAVNVTLGLPIIRTSVDHGTALDLAGTGRADIGSLQTAIDTAVEMASAKQQASR